MSSYISTLDTPVGPFSTVADDDGAVLASGFTADADALLPLIHPTLRPAARLLRRPDLGATSKAVLRYLDGDLGAVAEVPVRQYSDGQFLTRAWDALRQVAPGAPASYAQLAARSGRPTAVRAAAQACARNAVALYLPCHRVVRGDGSLGGFRWGLPVKSWLLDHERRHTQPAS